MSSNRSEEVKSISALVKKLTENPLVLVYFFSNCNDCYKIDKIYDFSIPKYPSVTFLEVDSENSVDISKKYDVEFVPTFIPFKNGRRIQIDYDDSEEIRLSKALEALVPEGPINNQDDDNNNDEEEEVDQKMEESISQIQQTSKNYAQSEIVNEDKKGEELLCDICDTYYDEFSVHKKFGFIVCKNCCQKNKNNIFKSLLHDHPICRFEKECLCNICNKSCTESKSCKRCNYYLCKKCYESSKIEIQFLD